MGRPKKKKPDQGQIEETKSKAPKPKEGIPPIIATIGALMDEYEGEYGHPPSTLTLNHDHYKVLLAIRGSSHYTIHLGTGRIDKIMGMIYFLDADEEDMAVR